MKKTALSLFLLLAATCLWAQPYLKKQGTATQLMVKGEPFLMIGGELGNSSATTVSDVRRIFPHLRALGLNTVLVPACWELCEPREGKFDFSLIDATLAEARKNRLKIVFLWFGAWKNSMSCYAPEWFKRDTRRFPRVHNAAGKPLEEASSLSRNVLEADKKAFCELIRHIADVDRDEQTVIMVQVENEIGMIECPRDYSDDATRLFRQAVPGQLTAFLKKNKKELHPQMLAKWQSSNCATQGTWTELFGDDIYTEEIFQSWTYALYAQEIASAGRAIYDIPMFVNVALNSRGRKPGEYPSGGPLDHLIDIWHCGAPAIDILGLDLYDKGFLSWVAKYKRHNNPLFIPEIRLEDCDAVRALYAFGECDAMGFCPFSIEDYPLLKGKRDDWRNNTPDLSADDQLNAFSQHSDNITPLAASYRILNQLQPLILSKQGTGEMNGVLLTNGERERIICKDGIRMTVRHSYSMGWEPGSQENDWPESGALIIRLGKEEYLIAGSGIVVTFAPQGSGETWQKGDGCIGIAACREVEWKEGQMQTIRHLSGDQTHQGRHIRIPAGKFSIQYVKLYPYK